MIGAAGTFQAPKDKPWNYVPPKVDGTNFWDLTDKEIEELSEDELFLIGRTVWKRLPTKDIFKLTEKIIKKKNDGIR